MNRAETKKTFDFEGFAIPVDLAELTGGGQETWDGIARAHLAAYERYSPIQAGHSVLEVGCGVGRDAILLASILGRTGSYLGVDVSGPSIRWCRENITPRYSTVRFEHLDIQSNFYNRDGALEATTVRLPLASECTDRIILQSVFTHMFEDAIVHFLSEFRRVLRPGGLVFTSLFMVDEESIRLAAQHELVLRFEHPWADGCRIADPRNPEGAVGYTPEALNRMLRRSGMALAQPVHPGSWCGRPEVPDGQDIAILKPAPGLTRVRSVLSAISSPRRAWSSTAK